MPKKFQIPKSIIFYFCVLFVLIFAACSANQKTDLRRFAPADSFAYFEINNLRETLDALVDNQTFRQFNVGKPDFSALENIQIAVAVTGFETTENKVSDENSILNVKPKFVVVAETHAWNWQAVRLVENNFDGFVKNVFGADAKFERINESNGVFYVWQVGDGRRLFAAVRDSRIFFANDKTAVEKSLAASANEADSLLKNEAFGKIYAANAVKNLAFGYVAPDGLAQIANLAGVSVAIDASEDDAPRSFIARVVPQILKNTVREIVWTAKKSDAGIEDFYQISLPTETVNVFGETLASADVRSNALEFLPADVSAATVYNLKNPPLAWRSLLYVTAKNADVLTGKMLVQSSNSLLHDYGIADAEKFLGAVNSPIITARFDGDEDKSIVIADVADEANIKSAIGDEINFKSAPMSAGAAQIWQSEDKQLAAAFVGSKLILGDAASVLRSVTANQSGNNLMQNQPFQTLNNGGATARTVAADETAFIKIVEFLMQKEIENREVKAFYSTQTNFTGKGIERRTVSDFGLLGDILEQIADDKVN